MGANGWIKWMLMLFSSSKKYQFIIFHIDYFGNDGTEKMYERVWTMNE